MKTSGAELLSEIDGALGACARILYPALCQRHARRAESYDQFPAHIADLLRERQSLLQNLLCDLQLAAVVVADPEHRQICRQDIGQSMALCRIDTLRKPVSGAEHPSALIPGIADTAVCTCQLCR